MSRRWHWLRTALAALVATALLSGVGVARGDLFDDDFTDCPSSLRFEEEKDLITDLTVSRSAETQGEITVSWKTADPASWGLGATSFYDAPHTAEARADAARLAGWWEANAFNVSHVVILDDKVNPPVEKRTPLGTTSVTFENVATHTEAEVQLALVAVSDAGDVVVSDILQTNVLENLAEQGLDDQGLLLMDKPSFSTPWEYQAADSNGNLIPNDQLSGDNLTKYKKTPKGAFYYIGYDYSFVNYSVDRSVPFADGDYYHTHPSPDLAPGSTYPPPIRLHLRIGLKHSGKPDADTLEEIDFKSYTIRISDEDGDQVGATVLTVPPGNVPLGYTQPRPNGQTTYFEFKLDPDLPFEKDTIYNVNVVDGDERYPAVNIEDDLYIVGEEHFYDILQVGGSALQDVPGVVFVEIGGRYDVLPPDPVTSIRSIQYNRYDPWWATPPDEIGMFPTDIFSTGTTYTIEAQGINKDGKTISPKTLLTVRADTTTYPALAAGAAQLHALRDTMNIIRPDPNLNRLTYDPRRFSNEFVVTAFTVIKK